MKFPKEEAALKLAQDRLEDKVNKALPIGTHVVVKSGRGLSYGTITHGLRGDTMYVINTKTGRNHHHHFHDIERECP